MPHERSAIDLCWGELANGFRPEEFLPVTRPAVILLPVNHEGLPVMDLYSASCKIRRREGEAPAEPQLFQEFRGFERTLTLPEARFCKNLYCRKLVGVESLVGKSSFSGSLPRYLKGRA